tara:strand:- start:2870 stop:3319 length:450 start_codon:yes stop_codon:yes gene_type:complete
MRPNSNYKRNRNRNQNRRNGNGSSNKLNNIDSSGPEIRVRGSAIQVNEKYLALGNDAFMSGDRIKAEAFFQHAEHYYRVFMLANGGIDPRKVSAEENVVKEVSENDLKTTDNEKDQKASSSDEKIDNDLNKIKEQKIDTEEENIISSVN